MLSCLVVASPKNIDWSTNHTKIIGKKHVENHQPVILGGQNPAKIRGSRSTGSRAFFFSFSLLTAFGTQEGFPRCVRASHQRTMHNEMIQVPYLAVTPHEFPNGFHRWQPIRMNRARSFVKSRMSSQAIETTRSEVSKATVLPEGWACWLYDMTPPSCKPPFSSEKNWLRLDPREAEKILAFPNDVKGCWVNVGQLV